jgi:hypothetical protein
MHWIQELKRAELISPPINIPGCLRPSSFCQCFQAPRVNLISLCAKCHRRAKTLSQCTSLDQRALLRQPRKKQEKKAATLFCWCLRAKDLCISASARRAFKRACCAALITTKGVLLLSGSAAAIPGPAVHSTGRRLHSFIFSTARFM